MSKVYHPNIHLLQYDKNVEKQCPDCLKLLPATPDYFHRDRWHRDGLNPLCRDCDYKRTYKKKRPQPIQLTLQKQCRTCLKWLDPTPEFFYGRKNTDALSLDCKECEKKRVNGSRFTEKVALVCANCGKEFQRGKTLYEYRVRKSGSEVVYCSLSCNKSRAKEWPESIGEEYLAGTTMNELAKKYGFTARGVQIHLREMGIETGFTEAVRKRISEAGIQRYNDPNEREKQRQHTYQRMLNGEFQFSSKLEDRVAQELSRQGFVFTRQYFMSTPGIQGFFACVDFLLIDKTVIEVNGTYWHADPRKYPDGPIFETQRKRVESDQRKREILTKLGIPIVELWEMDLEADMSGTIARALGSPR